MGSAGLIQGFLFICKAGLGAFRLYAKLAKALALAQMFGLARPRLCESGHPSHNFLIC